MKKFITSMIICVSLVSCGIYSFTGGNTGKAKTYQVDYFVNNAPIVHVGLDRDFTIALQDFIQGQTNLSLTRNNADLQYSGEITRFDVSPMSATANQTASQNRLTIGVKVRFVNKLDETKDFESDFSFFYDFEANKQLEEVSTEAFQIIFERINQDIFNKSIANW